MVASEDVPRLRVVATVGMVADLVRQIGGEDVEVTQLIGSGIDPHLYRPTRSDIAALMAAEAVFYCGFKLEGRLADVLERMARDGRNVIAVVETLLPERMLVHEGVPDPHAWMDVSLWMEAAGVVERSLSRFDPARAPRYAERAAAYHEQLRELDEYAQEVLSTVPSSARLLVTAHDAFHYFGRAYGFEVVGIQGVSTESEAGLERIGKLVDTLVERRVPAVFVETSVSDRNVLALIEGASARGHAVALGPALYSDAMGPDGTYEGTYIGMIDHNVTSIARALGGAPPPSGFRGWKEGRP
ncbi:MAG: zinc ABC transporter substrate-binding protein [Kiritimatiellae bacterium]|nr:zinc ABC transporter substrate-binding protein [Kiritimatiellia bacterium]MDW8458261.1 zinc ABC transporter substrate-binding protein [Verrucomicrobiota bacterium]